MAKLEHGPFFISVVTPFGVTKSLSLFRQIVKSIEDLKMSIGERDSAVRKAEDGAADLKKRVDDLSKNLEGYEKEYQVLKC